MKQKVSRGKPYKSEYITCYGGPFNNGRISMGPAQIETLQFSIGGGDPGYYSRYYTGSKVANWQPAPKTIIRKGATCGASL